MPTTTDRLWDAWREDILRLWRGHSTDDINTDDVGDTIHIPLRDNSTSTIRSYRIPRPRRRQQSNTIFEELTFANDGI